MDPDTRIKLALLREKYGNAFLSTCVQTKRMLVKKAGDNWMFVSIYEVLDYLWNLEGSKQDQSSGEG